MVEISTSSMNRTGVRHAAGSVCSTAASMSSRSRKRPGSAGTSFCLSSAHQAGWVKSPVATTPIPLRHAQAARCSRSRSRLVAREYFEWTCRSAWKRIWCPDSEVRKLLRHPLMRTSESKGHQQIYDCSVVLDLKFLNEPAATMAGTSNPPHCHALFQAAPCSSELRGRSGGASGENQRADIKARFGRKRKAPPVDIRALGVGAASLLSAAAQDSTMGAPPDLREVERFSLNELIGLENPRS